MFSIKRTVTEWLLSQIQPTLAQHQADINELVKQNLNLEGRIEDVVRTTDDLYTSMDEIKNDMLDESAVNDIVYDSCYDKHDIDGLIGEVNSDISYLRDKLEETTDENFIDMNLKLSKLQNLYTDLMPILDEFKTKHDRLVQDTLEIKLVLMANTLKTDFEEFIGSMKDNENSPTIN